MVAQQPESPKESNPHIVSSENDGPLTGIKILDLTRVLAGPLCTMTLGDMGADVIKVEQPGQGDDTRSWGPPFVGPFSAYYLAVNRNKRSLTLDVKSEEGRDLLRRMIADADVVIDNFKLGTMENWGFDNEWFEANAPGVVRCSITGYGATGPKAHKPGYDFILQAETGLMSITGEVDGAPMKLGVAIVDVCAGLTAAIAVLGALQARTSTGLGQHCEVSLHDVGLQMLINVASNHLVSGEKALRFGNSHPNIVPYRTYTAADGEVAIGVGNDRQFAALAAVLEHPEWKDDPRFTRNQDRVNNREVIDREIAAVIAHRTRGLIGSISSRASVCPWARSTPWPRHWPVRRPWLDRWWSTCHSNQGIRSEGWACPFNSRRRLTRSAEPLRSSVPTRPRS